MIGFARPGRCRPRRVDQRGSATVELALLVPALVVMLGLLVAGGRLWFARTTVTEAAQASARAASLARTAGEASREAQTAGQTSLRTQGLNCEQPTVTIDADAFAVPVGQPATIRSSVSCTVPFADVLLPGIPGSITVRGAAASALDTYRGRR